jgi:uncharacterized membrane protein
MTNSVWTDSVWNAVLIALVTLSAVGVIAIISLIDMGLLGGTMSCGVGISGGWLVGLPLIAVIVGASILLLRRRPQH